MKRRLVFIFFILCIFTTQAGAARFAFIRQDGETSSLPAAASGFLGIPTPNGSLVIPTIEIVTTDVDIKLKWNTVDGATGYNVYWAATDPTIKETQRKTTKRGQGGRC